MDKLSNIVGKNIQGIFREYKNMDKSYVYIGCGSLEQCNKRALAWKQIKTMNRF